MTPKQRFFALEYLLDMNAKRAATAAGYSPKTAEQQGYQLLQNPEVARFVAEQQGKRAHKLEVTADRIAEEMAKIGFSDIRRAVRWQTVAMSADEVSEELEQQAQGGALKRSRSAVSADVVLIDSEDLDDDTAAAISEVSQGPHGLKVKMYNKIEALNSLARWKGMFKDEIQINGPVSFVIEGAPERGRKG